MGSVISARQLNESLEKAKDLGIWEESVTIGDCALVLRNLLPHEYEDIVEETSEKEDVKYMNLWQKAHISRAIVEVNGLDLRGISFVEDEEPDPKDKNKTKTVKRELHAWLMKNVLSTWSKEAIYVAFRKVLDVVSVAEKKSQAGVNFVIPEETAEDKYRRLLGELKELESEVPPKLLVAVLEEYGYALSRTKDQEALKDFDRTVSEEAGTETSPQEAPSRPPTQPPSESDNALRAAEIMRQRVPLNQRPVDVPEAPKAPPPPPVVNVVPAQSAAPPPVQPVMSPRSAEIAAQLGSEMGVHDQDLAAMRAAPPQAVLPPGMAPPPGAENAFVQPGAIPKAVVTKGARHTDPAAMAQILNTKPTGVINPRFRPPTGTR